jgi:hypothetical protein
MRKREKIWKRDTYKNPNKSVERDSKGECGRKIENNK